MFIFVGLNSYSQLLVPKSKLKLPTSINETSGIEFINDSIWVTHNDSGDDPLLYFLNKKGTIKEKIKVKSASNIDWEDITYDDSKYLYISDLGNNLNNRKNLKIYQYNLNDSSVKNFHIHYKDQKFPTSETNKNFDSEAIAFRENKIYIFTKNYTSPYTGNTKYYILNPKDTNTYLNAIDSISLGKEGFLKNSVTGADFSNDGKMLALLTYKYLHLFYEFPKDSIFNGKHAQFLLPEIQQREAICFDSLNNIWLTDERSRLKNGGYLYYYDLSNFYNGESQYKNPELGIVSAKLNKKYSDVNGLDNCSFTISAEITESGRYTLDILKNGELFKTYWNEWKISDKKIELEYYMGEKVNKKDEYTFRIYRNSNLIYSGKIKL